MPLLSAPHDLPPPTACFTFSVADWTVSCAQVLTQVRDKERPEALTKGAN